MTDHIDAERLFRAAVDEPPPPDVTDEDDGRRGDGPHHVHVQMVPPLLIVHPDGGHYTDSWVGSLLVAWFHVATFVTVAVALYGLWAWMSAAGALFFLAASFIGLGPLFAALMVGNASVLVWRRWRARRERAKAQ